jgi:uncharacterized protein YcfJ
MNAILKSSLALVGAAFAAQAAAQVSFYENEGFAGRSFTTDQRVADMERTGFNNRASSVLVTRSNWEVCDDVRFGGRCVVLRPGRYPSLASMGLNDRVSSVRAVAANVRIDESRYAPLPVASKVTFYESESFTGRSFTSDKPVPSFERAGFNDLASSVEVIGERWEACEERRFQGRCVVLRPGRYPSLRSMGLENRVSSVRAISADARVEDSRYAPVAEVGRDGRNYRRRNQERVYEANVTAVRAVVGTPDQRCWVEREQIPQERSQVNVPAGIAGALIGGILGHQVGNGSGKDIATAGGAVAGGLLGANINRLTGTQQVAQTRDVQKCASVPNAARPDYWDVTYHFRGQDYRVQLTAPPGPTVTVNERGEPRA